jgi:tetratricopeptide (TPR) repeat protein
MNSGGLMKSFVESCRTALVRLLLAAATSVVYWQVSGFEFTNYDDDWMLLKNPFVLGGLTLNGLSWVLTTSWFEYWHPLTWLSHMLDCELFGLSPGWHHLVSLGFHVANTLLLFAVLQRMTGTLGRSAMVAALFALHPLHVESVAWIAERKDVLSAFFFFLTLWAYVRYVEVQSLKSKVQGLKSESRSLEPEGSPKCEVRSSKPSASGPWFLRPLPSSLFYLLSLLFFVCGLMSKPMVVTLPFVLLLLDHWPLGRMQNYGPQTTAHGPRATHHASRFTFHVSRSTLLPLLIEKLPFFALTVASCAVTYLGVRAGGYMLSVQKVPWGLRLANVPVSYARYLGKMIWPTNLAALYPMPSHWAWWQVGGALVVLLLCFLVAGALVRRQPWLAVGWFWFLGTLVPVIGLVQVGHHAIADRYTYLPLVGLFIALVWGGFELLRGLRAPRTIAWAVSGLILLACLGSGWAQTRYWRNSLTLWTRALAVTTNNARAHHNYGLVLEQCGLFRESIEHYREALRIEPHFFEAHNNLGCALYQLGQLHEATNHLMQAVRIYPDKSSAHVNLGRVLAALGDWSGAREHYEAAMAAEPGNPARPTAWGKVLLEHDKATEALEWFAHALQLDPNFAEARVGYASALGQLGAGLAAEGKLEQAIQQYREALRLQPDVPEVLNNLAWLLATANDAQLRNGAEAVRSAKRACELTQYQQVMMVGTLAAAYAEDGRLEEARNMAQKAIALAEASGQTELSARNRELLRLYEAGQPCRQ